VTTTDQGKYSGAVQFSGKKYAFLRPVQLRRSRDDYPSAQAVQSPITVQLDLSKTDSDQISGGVTDGSWSSPLQAWRAVFDGRTNLAPQAGIYTLLIPGTPGATDTPAGDGLRNRKSRRLGRVQFKAALAGRHESNAERDGFKRRRMAGIPCRPTRARARCWAGCCSPLHLPRTWAGCWIGARDSSFQTDFYSDGLCFRDYRSGDRIHSDVSNAASLTSAKDSCRCHRGNLAQSFTDHIILPGNNKVGNLDSNALTLSINPASGTV